MYLKIHTGQDRQIVAIADKEIIGKNFEEGNLQLNVSEYFYKGKEISEEEAMAILKKAKNLNLVGKKIINIALKNDVVDEENILRIQGIPHACIFI